MARVFRHLVRLRKFPLAACACTVILLAFGSIISSVSGAPLLNSTTTINATAIANPQTLEVKVQNTTLANATISGNQSRGISQPIPLLNSTQLSNSTNLQVAKTSNSTGKQTTVAKASVPPNLPGYIPQQSWQPTGCCPPHPTGTPFTVVLDSHPPAQAKAGDELTLSGHVVLGRAANSDISKYNVSESYYDTSYSRLQLIVNLFKADAGQDPLQTSRNMAFCDELANKTVTAGANGTFTIQWKVAPTTADGKKAIIYLTAFTGYTGSTINYAAVTTASFELAVSGAASGLTAPTTNCFNHFNNPTTASALGKITVGGSPQKVAVNPATNRVYVTNFGTNSIAVIDGRTNTLLTSIDANTGTSGIAVNPNTNKIYAAVNKGILVIDGSSNKIITTVPNGDFASAIAVNSKTDRVYATNLNLNSVAVFDGRNNTLITQVQVDRMPQGVAVNADTNKVYVSSFSQGTVTVIDGLTNSVVKKISLGDSSDIVPYDIAVNQKNGRVYVSNYDFQSVSVIHGNSLNSTAKVGYQLQGIAVDSTTNKVYAIAPGYDDGTVFVLDGKTNSVIASVELNRDYNDAAYYAAMNSDTGRLYVTTTNGVSDIDTHAIINNLGVESIPVPEPSNLTSQANATVIAGNPAPKTHDHVPTGNTSSTEKPMSNASSSAHPANSQQKPANPPSTETPQSTTISAVNNASNPNVQAVQTQPKTNKSMAAPPAINVTDTKNKTSTVVPLVHVVLPDIFRYIPPALLISGGISHNSSMIATMQGHKLLANPLFIIPQKVSTILKNGQLVTFTFFGDQPENNTIVAQFANKSQSYPMPLQDMCKPYDPMCQHVFRINNMPAGEYLLLVSSYHKDYIAYYALKVQVK